MRTQETLGEDDQLSGKTATKSQDTTSMSKVPDLCSKPTNTAELRDFEIEQTVGSTSHLKIVKTTKKQISI
jgi:hypothetical protein